MAKRERCSKRKIEAMINFIEQHKELIHPGEFPEWEQLKTELNNMEGPTRSIRQWKNVLNDLKTKARRKAHILKCELNKTGGGPNAGKPLTAIENRLLALLDKVTIEGLDEIPELGLQSEDVPVVSQIATAVEVQEVLLLHNEPIACASSNTGHSYGDIQVLIQSNNNIATSNNNIARAISKLANVLGKK
ncbi:Myb/SANT-like DNA-binding domain [Popillia japonica]|uniref:Regulatory protein zeste n=1 Tax=Popillia japonica TaxID=7064 RepID=A0AAW1L3V2_POPJA